jgi:hypothetical protein
MSSFILKLHGTTYFDYLFGEQACRTVCVHFYWQPHMWIDQLAQASQKSEYLTRKMDQ